jgi:two-component system, NarL family, nitrate/nitrite response regulator NarL
MARKYSSPVSAKRAHSRECSPAITVLVADESRMGCQLMASALTQSQYPIKVTALALDSAGVRNAVKDTQPEVAVMGARLKDGPNMGLKTARELCVSGSKTKVIILIDATATGMIIETLQAGAHGIISRDDPIERLCKCIDVVRQGQVWINTNQMLYLIDYLVKTAPVSVASVAGSNVLTKREEGVVRLVGDGMTNRAISHHLHLSENTVRNYLFRIFNKLGTSTRLELALYENNRRRAHGISESSGGGAAPMAENHPAVSPRLV